MKGPGKGRTNNPKGKPKGAVNRTTKELREAMISFIDANVDKLQKDFDSLDPKDRLAFFEKAIKLILPPPPDPSHLTESQLLEIIEYLKTQKNE